MSNHSSFTAPAAATSPVPPARSSGPGRPRILDSTRQREICALVSAGGSLGEAARYVRASVYTIRREARRDPAFGERLRNAELSARMRPLTAMNEAVETHWRAAAWMLERTMPERFGRPPAKQGLNGREARRLAKDLSAILDSEVLPGPTRDRLEERIISAVESTTRPDTNCGARNFRQAMALRPTKDEGASEPQEGSLPPTDEESLARQCISPRHECAAEGQHDLAPPVAGQHEEQTPEMSDRVATPRVRALDNDSQAQLSGDESPQPGPSSPPSASPTKARGRSRAATKRSRAKFATGSKRSFAESPVALRKILHPTTKLATSLSEFCTEK